MLTTKAIPVSYQPTMFKNYITRLQGIVGEKKATEILNGAIVVLSAGTNDFILNFYDIPTRGLQFPRISDYQDFVLKRLEQFVKVHSRATRPIAHLIKTKIVCSRLLSALKIEQSSMSCMSPSLKIETIINVHLIFSICVYVGALQFRVPKIFGAGLSPMGCLPILMTTKHRRGITKTHSCTMKSFKS